MKKGLKIILPVVILALALGLAFYQIKHKPMPQKADKKKINPMVRVETAETADYVSRAMGFGTVQAASSMNIVNDVAGRVIYVNPDLKAGQSFKKGELLYSIETETYESVLASARSGLRSAQYELAKTEQEADVSVKEWDIWNSTAENAKKPSPLIKYEPQLAAGRAAVEYAEKAVAKAEADLLKTAYRAPFDCVVSSENIEPGMVIKSGESAGVLVGAHAYEVAVPVLAKDEADIILSEDMKRASGADVVLTEGPKSWRWTGYASRTLPDADTKTGMIKIVVTVPEPNRKENGRPTLTIGSNVECVIKGKVIRGLTSISKSAVRENNTVWVYKEGRLNIRTAAVAGTDENRAYLSAGVTAGEQVIISRVQGAVDQMSVTLNEKPGAAK